MPRLLLATHNRDKVIELRALLRGVPVEVIDLERYPDVGAVAEDAETLEGNALLKAREVFRQTGIPSLGDDSGLEVFYLNGAPGVFSARFAGPDATPADNCRKLLHALKGIPPRKRTARFRCVIAFVASTSIELVVEGICSGAITEEPRGVHGFGYDPLFLPKGYAETFAEMTGEQKNLISHRAHALRKIRHVLGEFFS
jgi:XTP/dITP diphosphohydrolase